MRRLLIALAIGHAYHIPPHAYHGYAHSPSYRLALTQISNLVLAPSHRGCTTVQGTMIWLCEAISRWPRVLSSAGRRSGVPDFATY